MTDQTKKGLRIVRRLNAPKEVVFQAFANKEAMGEWWGPAGMTLVVHAFEFAPGGKFHYQMVGSQTMWGLFKFVNISEPNVIEFISSFSDEQGNVCTSPFPMDFPLEVLNKITLGEADGMTTLTLEGHPLNATPEQEETYHSIKDSMHEGFGGTFDKLDRFLKSQNS